MLNVFKTTKFVLDNSCSVKINRIKIKELAKSITEDDLKLSYIGLNKYTWDFNKLHYIDFVFNSLVYCFWANKDQPKWTIKDGGSSIDGSVALFRVLENEAKANKSFFKPSYLENFTYEDGKKLFEGNTEIPLLNSRITCIREVGYVLKRKFGGNVNNIIEASGNDALKMVSIISDNFPLFNDIRSYKGTKVGFYKRATLHAKTVNDLLTQFKKKQLSNMSKLTAIADYKIPQILRSFEILEYTKDLANLIDNYKTIDENCEYEVEIRAADIWAIKFITKELNKKFPKIVDVDTDCVLWVMSQQVKPNIKPYHRTLTVDY
ncbi:MAG: hypothetical protein ACD_22C00106G0007 [uncultured bacterium]|nr:MAG: hypothetical protein ACD_22C00106G0007 [uncultured bacterium]